MLVSQDFLATKKILKDKIFAMVTSANIKPKADTTELEELLLILILTTLAVLKESEMTTKDSKNDKLIIKRS